MYFGWSAKDAHGRKWQSLIDQIQEHGLHESYRQELVEGCFLEVDFERIVNDGETKFKLVTVAFSEHGIDEGDYGMVKIYKAGEESRDLEPDYLRHEDPAISKALYREVLEALEIHKRQASK